MDDELSIRRMVEDALTQFGYEVVGVQDGQAAIDLVSRSLANGIPFEVTILDLTVPGAMGGKEAIQHLKTLDPHLKAIVTSGYSDDPIMCDYQNMDFRESWLNPIKFQTSPTFSNRCSLSIASNVKPFQSGAPACRKFH